MAFIDPETLFMRRALELANAVLYTTTPNPRVGCVIVANGEIIGEGATQPAGGGHAEVQAIDDARRRGREVRGSTAYVTLEPCSHHGRTPPCTNLLIASGIAKVVAAVEDPNPLVAGGGLAQLRSAGIEVVHGICAEEARELNIGFFSRMQRGRPWIRMKVAASLDGKSALLNGQSKWITSQAARDDGHHWRARACAVLTGIGTVAADDPAMTVRAVATPRQPFRIVIDSRMEIDPQAKVLDGGGTLVVAACERPDKAHLLTDRGAEIVVLPNAHGKVELPRLMRLLGSRGINELHVEAGAKLNGSMLREGCVDELLVYLAPDLLGDGLNMFDLPRIDALDRKMGFSFHSVEQVGRDLRILARLLSN